ncbi:MAG: hypothetical protein IJE17_11955 [Clostridia bacterium]|nr:hypothetical protein [Clostridia bacterium]MBQ6805199.1 hypothetical protein [Clostridia bacterium]MDD6682225.1 sigma factor G inhibitor Gin [Clostridiales bacterium]
MNEDRCILCGRSFPTGLNILGCLICFPCEKRLLQGGMPGRKRKRLCHIYRQMEA